MISESRDKNVIVVGNNDNNVVHGVGVVVEWSDVFEFERYALRSIGRMNAKTKLCAWKWPFLWRHDYIGHHLNRDSGIIAIILLVVLWCRACIADARFGCAQNSTVAQAHMGITLMSCEIREMPTDVASAAPCIQFLFSANGAIPQCDWTIFDFECANRDAFANIKWPDKRFVVYLAFTSLAAPDTCRLWMGDGGIFSDFREFIFLPK